MQGQPFIKETLQKRKKKKEKKEKKRRKRKKESLLKFKAHIAPHTVIVGNFTPYSQQWTYHGNKLNRDTVKLNRSYDPKEFNRYQKSILLENKRIYLLLSTTWYLWYHLQN